MKGIGNPQGLQWGFGAAEICSSPIYLWLVSSGGDPRVSGFRFASCGANRPGSWVVMAHVPKLTSGVLEREIPQGGWHGGVGAMTPGGRGGGARLASQ